MSDWRPSTTTAVLHARADLYRRIRGFFAARDYLEVDPPLLGRGGTTDPAIESFRTEHAGRDYYLQTSPEFFMKRLLAAGSGPIYALSKVFRQDEEGRHHNPEFTLLEWYRPGFDDHALMVEVGEFLGEILDAPIQKFTYRQVFSNVLQIDPHIARLDQLKDCARKQLSVTWDDNNRDVWLDLLFSHLIQPKLGKVITFIHDYPASQAALAKITEDDTGQKIARRFEVFFNGVELANGYWELTDAKEQAQRFAADNEHRRASQQPPVAVDTKLIEALESGLPDCAGVALGVDRLLMLATDADKIEDVVVFPWSRL
ncbi:MAG: EF-P lysine aminoacylase EpmA [Cellvibrionaceae bacterium]